MADDSKIRQLFFFGDPKDQFHLFVHSPRPARGGRKSVTREVECDDVKMGRQS